MRVAETREAALFGVMENFPSEGCVVIGGYAVSARTVPRYSHDIDLVVDSGSAGAVRDFLETKKLVPMRRRVGIEQNYGGSWERWQRGRGGPTVDVLTSSVEDREFEIAFPYERVARRADLRELRGLRESAVAVYVASVEVLIALKVQPMRERDIGDVACLAGAGFDGPELRRILAPVLEQKPSLLRERLDRYDGALGANQATAQRFLGGRIPGPAVVREPYIRAARGLSGMLRGWAAA